MNPKFKHPFDRYFKQFDSYATIHRQLNNLLYHLQVEQACLKNINFALKPFVACYKYCDNEAGASHKSASLFADLHKHLFKRSVDSWRFLQSSPFTPLITFWLKAVWSIHYSKNPELNLKFEMIDIEWKHIPVSALEIVRWHDMILGMICEFRHAEFMCDQWLKYWALKLFKCNGFILILDNMIDRVTKAIEEINAAMAQSH